MDHFDVVIIGSGPAGYTAATYTSRAFLKTLVIAGPQPGGQLTTTTEVDNFPGFPDGIQGPELLSNMKKQAERFGTQVVVDEVLSLGRSDTKQEFAVRGSGGTYTTRSVIIATGASAKTLGIPTEDTFRGKGISYCATCDGFFFRGKSIAVLGGGDTAMEEATFLTKFASHVTIIHRRTAFRASPIMVEKAKQDPKISFLLNKTVDAFHGDATVQSILLTDIETGKQETLPIEGVFVAIGHQPATAFLKDFVALDPKGYVQVSKSAGSLEPQTQTSVPGIFAAGDCVDARYRQGVVAAGLGCQAALDVIQYLS